MLLEISQVRERLKLLDEENSSLLSANSHLITQLGIVNEMLFMSETKAEQLARVVEDQHTQQATVNSLSVRTQAIESQITMIESVRNTLKSLPTGSLEERRLVETRWKMTDRMLDTLIKQYEILEQEARLHDILPLAHHSDLSPSEVQPETPMHHFINTILDSEPHYSSDRDMVQSFNALQPTTEIHHHHHFQVLETPKSNRDKKVSFNTPTPQSRIACLPTPPDSVERTLRRVSSLPDARDDDSDTCISESIHSEDEYFDNYPLYNINKNTVRKFMSHESGLRNHSQQVPDELDLSQLAAPEEVLAPVKVSPAVCSTAEATPKPQRHRTKRYSNVGTPSLTEVTDVSAEFTFSAHSPTKSTSRSAAMLSAAVIRSGSSEQPSTPNPPQSLNHKLSSFFTKLRGSAYGALTPVKDSSLPEPATPSPTAIPTAPYLPSPASTRSASTPVVVTADAFRSPLDSDTPPARSLKPASSVMSLHSSMKHAPRPRSSLLSEQVLTGGFNELA